MRLIARCKLGAFSYFRTLVIALWILIHTHTLGTYLIQRLLITIISVVMRVSELDTIFPGHIYSSNVRLLILWLVTHILMF